MPSPSRTRKNSSSELPFGDDLVPHPRADSSGKASQGPFDATAVAFLLLLGLGFVDVHDVLRAERWFAELERLGLRLDFPRVVGAPLDPRPAQADRLRPWQPAQLRGMARPADQHLEPLGTAVQRVLLLGLRHRMLRMDDAAARGHPLRPTRGDDARVPRRVAVLLATGEDIGHGLDAGVRMRAHAVTLRFHAEGSEVIEKNPWADGVALSEGKRASNGERADGRDLGLRDVFDAAHVLLLEKCVRHFLSRL